MTEATSTLTRAALQGPPTRPGRLPEQSDSPYGNQEGLELAFQGARVTDTAIASV